MALFPPYLHHIHATPPLNHPSPPPHSKNKKMKTALSFVRSEMSVQPLLIKGRIWWSDSDSKCTQGDRSQYIFKYSIPLSYSPHFPKAIHINLWSLSLRPHHPGTSSSTHSPFRFLYQKLYTISMFSGSIFVQTILDEEIPVEKNKRLIAPKNPINSGGYILTLTVFHLMV